MTRPLTGIPLRPAYEPLRDPLKEWRRDIVCLAVAHARGSGVRVNDVAAELYGTKATTSPATMTSVSALAPTGTGVFLRSLRPRSASARLFERSTKVSLVGMASVNLPRMASFSGAGFSWVIEGDPIPVIQGTFATAALGPVKKLAAITTLTGELADMGAEAAEAIISLAMTEAAAVALDSSVFSTTAAWSARPAGLLNGVTPIGATSGGGLAALVGDLKLLAGAIATAGGGASIMIFANPAQAAALGAQMGTGFDIEVVATPAFAAGTIVAIETQGIAYVLDELPRVEASKESTIHMEDTTPLPIASTGSPNTVAAPTRSMFQTDSLALRLILRTTWGVRAPGLVQYITGTTW